MSGFRYIIASTLTVQEIMKNNEQEVQKKMKEKTKKITELGAKEHKSVRKSQSQIQDTESKNAPVGGSSKKIMDSKVGGIDADKIRSSIRSKVKSSRKLELDE